MTAATSPLASGAFATPEAGSDYFATDAHYQSLAGRIVAVLRRGGSFVLVTGDPPASPHTLCQTLSEAAASRHAVIRIPCGPKLKPDDLLRAATVLAGPAARDGATRDPEPSDPASPLFVFDDLDRLSDGQIKNIYDAMVLGDGVSAAAVLLARAGFLARLEEPALRLFKEGLAAHFRLQDVGPDEDIVLLRHHLAQRHCRSKARGRPTGMLGGVAFGVVAAASIGAFLLLSPVGERVGEPPASVEKRISSTEKESAPRPPASEAKSAEPVQAASAAEPAATFPTALLPSAPEEPPVRAPEAPPAHSPAGPRLSTAEITALEARGDAFLSQGDIASARLFYERAAEAGDGPAALRLGGTFDPAFLSRAGLRGIPGDPDQASSWYHRARDLGEAAAERQLKSNQTRPPLSWGPMRKACPSM